MTFFVVSDEKMPLVEIQIAEKRMRSAVQTEISVAICFQKVSRQFARGSERSNEHSFVANQFGLQRD